MVCDTTDTRPTYWCSTMQIVLWSRRACMRTHFSHKNCTTKTPILNSLAVHSFDSAKCRDALDVPTVAISPTIRDTIECNIVCSDFAANLSERNELQSMQRFAHLRSSPNSFAAIECLLVLLRSTIVRLNHRILYTFESMFSHIQPILFRINIDRQTPFDHRSKYYSRSEMKWFSFSLSFCGRWNKCKIITKIFSYDPLSGSRNANIVRKCGSLICVCAMLHWARQMALFSKLKPDNATAAIRKLLVSNELSAPRLNISIANRIFRWTQAMKAARVYSCFSQRISKNCLKLSLLLLSNVQPHKWRPYSRCSLLLASNKPKLNVISPQIHRNNSLVCLHRWSVWKVLPCQQNRLADAKHFFET